MAKDIVAEFGLAAKQGLILHKYSCFSDISCDMWMKIDKRNYG